MYKHEAVSVSTSRWIILEQNSHFSLDFLRVEITARGYMLRIFIDVSRFR